MFITQIDHSLRTVVIARQPAADMGSETLLFVVMGTMATWTWLGSFLWKHTLFWITNLVNSCVGHVNTAATDPFDPTAVRVNEPGRQVWMKLRYSF